MNLSVDQYAAIMMNRLNQLQNMQTTIMNSIGGFSIGLIAIVLRSSNLNTIDTEAVSVALLILCSVMLLVSHLFSLYQVAAIFKCGQVLKDLEMTMNSESQKLYFNDGNMKLRNWLHFLSHSMPSVILLIFPVCLSLLNLINWQCALVIIFIVIILSYIIWIMLEKALGLNKSKII